MKNLKPIYFWLLLTISLTTVVFTSCENDEDEPETTDNTQINSDGVTGTLTDIDGNIYAIIKIGEQWWMTENLKVTTYNDGTSIPNTIEISDWIASETPAYCWYNNDKETYVSNGALYNWYTVETNKLAPTGWHVPTNDEWTILENYLADNGYNYDGTTGGGSEKIAKSMATAFGWGSSTAEGSIGNNDYLEFQNKSGFTALPAGVRDYEKFVGNGATTYWWSDTESNTDDAWIRRMVYTGNDLSKVEVSKLMGFSVRCVKD